MQTPSFLSGLLKTTLVLVILLNITISTANAQWQWANSVSGPSQFTLSGDNVIANAVTTDAAGNIYVTGAYSSLSVTLGNDTLTNIAYSDILIVKYNTSGQVMWARSAGGNWNDFATSIKTDADGNVYITGYFNSPTITFDTITLTNVSVNNIFIAKYTSAGNVIWAKTAAGPTATDCEATSLAIDADGNTYITGYYNNATLTFDPVTITNSGSDDIFVVKYDPSGNVLWAKSTGNSGTEQGFSITTDPSGNVYVAGFSNDDTLTLNGVTLKGKVLVVKYDKYGSVVWGQALASSSTCDLLKATAILADAAGNVYVAGDFGEQTGYFGNSAGNFGFVYVNDIGADSLPQMDIFIAKFDTSGYINWAKIAGGPSENHANALALDGKGNLYVSGTSDQGSVMKFDGLTITTDDGYPHAYVAKYDTAGNVMGAEFETGYSNNYPASITTDADGGLYMAGYYTASMTIGNFILNDTYSNGSMFIAKNSGSALSTHNVTQASQNISLYPNPNNGKMTVMFNNGSYRSLQVYDCLGKIIYTTSLTGNERSAIINLRNLPSGTYFAEATGNGESAHLPFVVAH